MDPTSFLAIFAADLGDVPGGDWLWAVPYYDDDEHDDEYDDHDDGSKDNDGTNDDE